MRLSPQGLAYWLAEQASSTAALGAGVVGLGTQTLAGGFGFAQRELETLAGGVMTVNRAMLTALDTINRFNYALTTLADLLSQRVSAGFNMLLSFLRIFRSDTDIFTNLLDAINLSLANLFRLLQGGVSVIGLIGSVLSGVGQVIAEVTEIVAGLTRSIAEAFRAFSRFARDITGIVSSIASSVFGAIATVGFATAFGGVLLTQLGFGVMRTAFGGLGGLVAGAATGAGFAGAGMLGGAAAVGGVVGSVGALVAIVGTVLAASAMVIASVARTIIPILTPVIFPALLYYLARYGLGRFVPTLGTPVGAGLLTLGAAGALLVAPIVQAIGGLIPVIGRFVQAIGVALSAVGHLLQRIAEGLNRLLEITLRVIQGFIQAGLMLWRTFGLVAAQAQTVSIALQVMAANAGVARERIMSMWMALVRQNIALIEGGQAMIMLMARFYPLVGLTERLASVAKDWAAAMGFVSSEVLRDFSVAVTRGEISMLEHLNIVYASSLAWELFAQQIGKSAQDLNAFERSLAVADFLINRIGRSVAGVYEETFNSLGKLLSSFQRVIQTVQILAGRELLYPFTMLGKGIYSLLDALGKTLTEGARYGQGLRFLFASIAEGFTQGLEIVFQAPRQQFFERDPMRNPIARQILEVLNSPQFRQAALQLGGLVRAMTVWVGNLIMNIIRNLPQYLTLVINFFRQFVAVLIWVWTWLRAIAQTVMQLAQLFAGNLLRALNLSGQGFIGFLNAVAVGLAKALSFIGNFIQGAAHTVANFIEKLGGLMMTVATYIYVNSTTIAQWVANLVLNLQGLGAHMRRFAGEGLMLLSKFLAGLVLLVGAMAMAIPVALTFWGAVTGGVVGAGAGLAAGAAITFALYQFIAKPLAMTAAKLGEMGKQLKDEAQKELNEIFDPQKNPIADWAYNRLPQQLQQASTVINRWGYDLQQKAQSLRAFGDNIGLAFQIAAQGVLTATAEANQAATQFLDNTRGLSEQAVQSMQQMNEALMNAEQKFKAMREIVREVARGAQILGDASRQLIEYYNTLYGTLYDIGAISFARVLFAWREVEVAFTNISMMMAALRDRSINVRDVFGTLEELASELYEALAKWAKAVVDAFNTVRELVRGFGDAVRAAAEMSQALTWGSMAALNLLEIRRATLQTELQILAMTLRLPLGVEARTKTTQEYFQTLKAITEVTREELELVKQVAEAWGRALKETGDAARQLADKFALPIGFMINGLLQLRAIATEMQVTMLTVMRAMFFGDVPYTMFAEAVGRLNALRAQFIVTLSEMLNQPLRGVNQILDAQLDYWRKARDLVTSFNLGMFATLEIHLSEAAVLAEKLRLLELMAAVNRHNFEAYWRIRAEIVAIKRELFEIARRPVFIFGMTREQIERSFTDFQRLVGDPRFWRRWRLGEVQLTEMAFRAAVWQQQMGLVALQVFDPRFMRMLAQMGLTPAGLPMMRWAEMISELTGRRLPFPFQHLIIAMQETLLRGLTEVPPPFGGLPTPAYLMRFMPFVARVAGQYGLIPPMFEIPPSPFVPFMPAPLQALMPLMAQMAGIESPIALLSAMVAQGERLYVLMSNMAQLHAFYLPRISDTLAMHLQRVSEATFAFMTTAFARPITDPTEYVMMRRRFEAEMLRQRMGVAPQITYPVGAGAPRLGVGVPVVAGGQQVGVLYLSDEFLRQLVQAVLANSLRGYNMP